jgi:hypothetical protein
MALHEQAQGQLMEEIDQYRDMMTAVSNPLTVETMQQR